MYVFFLGIVVFFLACFFYAYLQTIKRCRMFYYYEVMQYAMKETPDEEPGQSLIDNVNNSAKKFKLSSQPSITEDMNYCVYSQFNGDNKKFMCYVRKLGYKG